MNTHVEHRILRRERAGLVVEITREVGKRVIATEYLIAPIGLQCEAYAIRKTDPGETYASFKEEREQVERYLVTVEPRTGEIRCDCKGCVGHRGAPCKHVVTIGHLRDEAEIGPKHDQAVDSLCLLNIPLTREQLDGAAARALLTLGEALAKATGAA